MSAEILGKRVERAFEQPPDAITCYAELAQTIVTEHEVILQFCEPVPGPPEGPGGPRIMRSRLRATIILNKPHAARLATSLAEGSRAAAGAAISPGPSGD